MVLPGPGSYQHPLFSPSFLSLRSTNTPSHPSTWFNLLPSFFWSLAISLPHRSSLVSSLRLPLVLELTSFPAPYTGYPIRDAGHFLLFNLLIITGRFFQFFETDSSFGKPCTWLHIFNHPLLLALVLSSAPSPSTSSTTSRVLGSTFSPYNPFPLSRCVYVFSISWSPWSSFTTSTHLSMYPIKSIHHP